MTENSPTEAVSAKNPGIVLPQVDLDNAVEEAVTGALSFNGLADPQMVSGMYAKAVGGYLIAVIIGVLAMAGEFRNGTAVATFLAAPRRLAVLAAKLVVAAGAGVVTMIVSTAAGVAAFDLQADAVGAPVSGYCARPEGARPKSLPIILTVHGAGVRSSSLGGTAGWAKRGFLALDINAHGIPNGKPE